MDSMFCHHDMKIEILSRTSLNTLNTLRCTSTEIRSLTYSSYFWDLYKQNNNIVSGFLVQNTGNNSYIHEFAPSRDSKTIDFSFLPEKSKILASSEQGLVVFQCPDPENNKQIRYHVCKPSTKQVLPLPNPKTRFITQKVAVVLMGLNPLHYKIIRLADPTHISMQYTTYRCEIFDSTKWIWRAIDLVTLPNHTHLDSQPITIGDSIYMLLTNNEVLKINANFETWTTFSLNIDYPCYTSRILMKYEDKLGFACKPPDGSWEIWVRNIIDESWEMMYAFEDNEDIEGFYDSDTRVMIKDNKRLMFSRFKRDNDIHEVVLRDEPNCKMFFLRSDFETLDLMEGLKETKMLSRAYVRMKRRLKGHMRMFVGWFGSIWKQITAEKFVVPMEGFYDSEGFVITTAEKFVVPMEGLYDSEGYVIEFASPDYGI